MSLNSKKSRLLAAALGLAFMFTISCGNHSWEELDEWLKGSSSSEEQLLSSSSIQQQSSSSNKASSSSQLGISSSSSLQQSSSSSQLGTSSSSGEEELLSSSSSERQSSSSSNKASSSSLQQSSSSSQLGTSSSSSMQQSSSSSRLGNSCDINGETVEIGNQIWMAENLNCDVAGSVCYDNDPDNCIKYGRLYDWATAMDVCPQNWHIPSTAEWSTLINYVESDIGCSNCAGRYLKSSSGWNEAGDGTDDFGFSALPSGASSLSGNFYGIGNNGHWWSSEGSIHAYIQIMFYNHDVAYWHDYNKSNLFSVRCVKN
jgi:uncharacterized protein (TIGR02145 family)